MIEKLNSDKERRIVRQCLSDQHPVGPIHSCVYGQLSPIYALLLWPNLKWEYYDVQEVLVPLLPHDVVTLIGLPVNAG
ncbi:hypothetical protein MKY37_00170 [Psychrobacillus sp. FSL K6-2836]|uniref:hypothetical protein n=1 Tax=Psychrobacillus sp. FSL K6-2836 TaxID=2921548 RepID=UPI0030FA564A